MVKRKILDLNATEDCKKTEKQWVSAKNKCEDFEARIVRI